MSYSTGIDYGAYSANYYNAKKLKGSYSSASSSEDTSILQGSASVDASGNTCTDGKDDGKISGGQKLWCGLKGIVKGAINGVKGMFTNAEGNFSIGKTLLTVGVGALCIAFPAVGAVACGIGAVTGAIGLGKGIYNASTAETDAEAKDAWEAIGEGASTVIGSVVGAKGALGAMKGASTGAIDDVAKVISKSDDIAAVLGKTDDITTILKQKGISNADDIAMALAKFEIDDLKSTSKVAEIIKKTGKLDDASALGALKNNKDATTVDKLKALGKDAWSSTRNNGSKIKTTVTTKYSEHKAAHKDYVEKRDAYNKAKGELDEASKAKLDEATRDYDKAKLEYNEKKAEFESAGSNASDEVKNAYKTAETELRQKSGNLQQKKNDLGLGELEKAMNEAKSNTTTAKLKKAWNENVTKPRQELETAKSKYQQIKNEYGEIYKNAKASVKKGQYPKADTVEYTALDRVNTARDGVADAAGNTLFGKLTRPIRQSKTAQNLGIVSDEGKIAFLNKLGPQLSKLKGFKWDNFTKGISDDVMAVLNFLTQNEGKVYLAINQYGYENVLQAAEVLYGYGLMDQA